MKNKIFISVILAIFIMVSCKKEKASPASSPRVPTLDIKFGHRYKGTYQFIPFSNQQTMPLDSISAYSHFFVSIVENNLPDNDTISFDMEFDVRTKNDSEHFATWNGIDSIALIYEPTFGYIKRLGAVFPLPYKISNIAVPDNDTLEFASAGDVAVVNYKSRQSALKGSDSLSINP